MSDVKFFVDYSKRLSKCKKCKLEIAKGDVRLAKLMPNFFGGDDEMKQYYHIKCLFETFQRARATTRKIESADDIEDFKSIKEDDKKLILSCIEARGSSKSKATTASNSPSTKSSSKATTSKKTVEVKTDTESSSSSDEEDKNAKRPKTAAVGDSDSDDGLKLDVDCDDNKFETFQKILEEITNESGNIKKTAILKDFFKNGISGSKVFYSIESKI